MAQQANRERLLNIGILVILLVEQPPALRHDTQHAEETRAHGCTRNALGLMLSAVAHDGEDFRLVNAHVLERATDALEVDHLVARESPQW
jgi:hypothetical protein